MKTIILFLLLCGLSFGQTTYVAPSLVQSVIQGIHDNDCVDGDTIQLPAGSATWRGNITITKGITLIGSGYSDNATADIRSDDTWGTIITDDMSTGTNLNDRCILRLSTTAGLTYRVSAIRFNRRLFDVTGVASTNVLTSTAHSLAVNDTIRFVSTATADPYDIPLTGGAGITTIPTTTYYVKTVPTADTFTIATTSGGTEVDFTTDITAGQFYRSLGSNYDRGVIRVDGTSSSVRFDHNCAMNPNREFLEWTNAFGVIDNCYVVLNAPGRFRFLKPAHRYNALTGNIDSYGDASWEMPVNHLGNRYATFMEDCDVYEDRTSSDPGAICDMIYGGGRIVVRFNKITNSYFGNHGTETSGRPRGGRMMEIHNNEFIVTGSTLAHVNDFRSGSGVCHDNTLTGLSSSLFKLNTYRMTESNRPWLQADGTKAWDYPNLSDPGQPTGATGDLVAGDGIFESGTLTSAGVNSAGDNTKTWIPNDKWKGYILRTKASFVASSAVPGVSVTVTGAGWTPSEWVGWEITRNLDNSKSVLSTSTTDTLSYRTTEIYKPLIAAGETFTLSFSGQIATSTVSSLTCSNGVGNTTPRTYKNGALYEIRRVSGALDDPGMGETTPFVEGYNTFYMNHQSVNQTWNDPCYFINNLQRVNSSASYTRGVVSTGGYLTIVQERNYYQDPLPPATFTGASGVGRGLWANRPTSGLTTGVGYWATDKGEWNSNNGTGTGNEDGELYVATGPTTWTLYHTPYTYPHPIRSGSSDPVDTNPPTLTSATIDSSGLILTIQFTEPVQNVTAAHYSISGGHTLGTATTNSNIITFPVSTTVTNAETLTLSYTSGVGRTADIAGNLLATIASRAITNNSLETTPIPNRPGRKGRGARNVIQGK